MIEPPQLKLGRYHAVKKHQTIIIQLNADSTFVYHKGAYSYSWGKWLIENNYLIFLSTQLSADDSIRIAISSGSYFKIEKMFFTIEEDAIVDKETKIRYKLEQ